MIVAVVYGAKSKILRRLVLTDESELHPSHLGDGEAVLFLNEHAPRHQEAAIRAIAKHHGIHHSQIPSARCVVVHPCTKLVIAALMADAEIDTHPDGYFVHHGEASVGWRHHRRGHFHARYVSVSPVDAGKGEVGRVAPHIVTGVTWADPRTPPEGYAIQHGTAGVGETIDLLVAVNVPSAGTRKI